MHSSRSGGGGDDDNAVEEDNDKNDDNKDDRDDMGVSALGLYRDLWFFAEQSEANPCGAASFAKPR